MAELQFEEQVRADGLDGPTNDDSLPSIDLVTHRSSRVWGRWNTTQKTGVVQLTQVKGPQQVRRAPANGSAAPRRKT